MPNYFVFDQINSPLFTKQVNTFISPGIDSAPEAGAAKAGILFAANFSSNISAGQNLILHTSNPAANSKTMYISRVSGSASAAGTTVTLLKNGTVSGAVVTPVNLNFGSSNSSGMSVISATGSAAGSPTTFLTLILQAGEFVIDFTGRIVVPPGHSLTVTVGLGAANATANVNWWEY
jgi:hypothetical protein